VSSLSSVAVAVMKAKMMEEGERVGLTRRMELPRLTASMLPLKLARLPCCLCW
jgi:hypothetical protein